MRARVRRDEERQARIERNLSRISEADLAQAKLPHPPPHLEPESRTQIVVPDPEVARATMEYTSALRDAERQGGLPEATGADPVVCERHQWRPRPAHAGAPQPPAGSCPSCSSEREALTAERATPPFVVVHLDHHGQPVKPLSLRAEEAVLALEEREEDDAVAASRVAGSCAWKFARTQEGRLALQAGRFAIELRRWALGRTAELREQEQARRADTFAARRTRHSRFWAREYGVGSGSELHRRARRAM
jgi:hypothetical protein